MVSIAMFVLPAPVEHENIFWENSCKIFKDLTCGCTNEHVFICPVGRFEDDRLDAIERFAVAEGPLSYWIQGGDGHQAVTHGHRGRIRNGDVDLLVLGVVDTLHGGRKSHFNSSHEGRSLFSFRQ